MLYLIFTVVVAFTILYIYRKTFKNTNAKTVYLVWQNLFNTDHQSSGFGDKIRGAIAINEFCRENNINFVVDGTDDISSKFLKNIKSSNYKTIKTKKLLSFPCDNNNNKCFVDILNENLSKSDTLYIYTNKCPSKGTCETYSSDLLSHADKEFGRFLCEPTDSFKKDIDETLESLPLGYGIQHFRFNDKVFKNDIHVNDPEFIKYYNILQSTYKSSDVLLSNSNNFKHYAKNMLGIKTVDCDNEICKAGHTGNNNNYEDIKSTFIEFYVIANAKYGKTISSYPWVSNFVKWPALIYDVPLEIHTIK